MRFMCHRCIKVRRLTKAIVFWGFVSLVLLVLALERLGFLKRHGG